jgi:hypothetical protein
MSIKRDRKHKPDKQLNTSSTKINIREAYDAAKSVSVLLMGINQKQLIAV